MSDNAHPPLRLTVDTFERASSKTIRSHLDAFLADYNMRMASKGGDTTVTTQVQKLRSSLSRTNKTGR